MYEPNVIVNLPISLLCSYLSHTIDNKVTCDLIVSNDLPIECDSISLNFQKGVNWINLGNNQYKIRIFEEYG
jgi:hypothetical protein